MQGCKERARDAGLVFEEETLEYIVTNRDMLELSPRNMIPTLYDYWVHDVEVLKEKGRYELYPNNPYETVINTRPAISFYNDNNPDWLNVMIFYHVIAHIDFFQNNVFFSNTWDSDFAGVALADNRLISRLRSEKGRWVDYIIEFTRGIDNLVGYYNVLATLDKSDDDTGPTRLDFYFNNFLQVVRKVSHSEYLNEIQRYNELQKKYGTDCQKFFFADLTMKYPELDALYEKYIQEHQKEKLDVIQYIMEHSPFINQPENIWIKSVMEVVHKTSLFFQPQIRTKIMNEGWASYWHEYLFLRDDRIKGNEVPFARVNAGVTSMPRVGLNPYALGMRLFNFIEELADSGKLSYQFDKLKDEYARKHFQGTPQNGRDFIFFIRQYYNDFMFLNEFVNQDFINVNRLFVVGKRLDRERMVWQYYVKSRKAEDYRNMLMDALYHPPYISVDIKKSDQGILYLYHHDEGKPLVKDFIANTMMGIEYLWGSPVKLETNEVLSTKPKAGPAGPFMAGIPQTPAESPTEIKFRRIIYSMEKRKLSKTVKTT